MKRFVILIIIVFCTFYVHAQYSFSGYIDNDRWQEDVYLSVIEDYRKISGVFSEQIIKKIQTDEKGYFEFIGNNLNIDNRIYRIHVDNCVDEKQNLNHFEGHCKDSKEILFIAKNTDTIAFPFSFENQMFCTIESNNLKARTFVKIDSLKEDMRFAYGEFRSEANRKLNNKKWFKTLKDFGENLNEPLAELYIYTFLSDRSNNLHAYYLEDLKTSNYYDQLLERLTNKYPNSTYTNQYKAELNADKFILSNEDEKSFNWNYFLYSILILSLIGNLWFLMSRRKHQSKTLSKAKEKLTNQELKILNLLLEENTNKEIAEVLFVSLSTVKSHVNNIYKKLNVQSRDEIKSLFNK